MSPLCDLFHQWTPLPDDTYAVELEDDAPPSLEITEKDRKLWDFLTTVPAGVDGKWLDPRTVLHQIWL